MMRKNCWALLLTLMLVFFTLTVQAEPAVEPDLPRSDAALSLMEYLEADPELMALMDESIRNYKVGKVSAPIDLTGF